MKEPLKKQPLKKKASTVAKVHRSTAKEPRNPDQSQRLLFLVHRAHTLSIDLLGRLGTSATCSAQLTVNKQDSWDTTSHADMAGEIHPTWKTVGFTFTYPNYKSEKREPGSMPYETIELSVNARSQDVMFAHLEDELAAVEKLVPKVEEERQKREKLTKRMRETFHPEDLQLMGIKL